MAREDKTLQLLELALQPLKEDISALQDDVRLLREDLAKRTMIIKLLGWIAPIIGTGIGYVALRIFGINK